MPLSDTAIRNAKPGEKTRRLYDSRGLYLEVLPRGGKWFRFKYRFNGKEKRLSLGIYPDVSLKKARDRRDKMRELVADGIDPSEHRKAMKAVGDDQNHNTFEVVTREWFNKQARVWKESHSSKIIQRFERDIFPWLDCLAIMPRA
jgi:hypothetical protein